MLTLTVKWLNGDLQSLEVLQETLAYKVIQQLGLALLETTLYMESGELVEHYHKFTQDAFVIILVQPAPVVIVVERRNGIDYYSSSMTSFSEVKPFVREIQYDTVFVNYLTYSFRNRKEICNRLGIPFAEHLSRGAFLHFLQDDFQDEGEVISWRDFGYCGNGLFPTLTENNKKYGMMSRKDWASYFVVKR